MIPLSSQLTAHPLNGQQNAFYQAAAQANQAEATPLLTSLHNRIANVAVRLTNTAVGVEHMLDALLGEMPPEPQDCATPILGSHTLAVIAGQVEVLEQLCARFEVSAQRLAQL